MTDMITPGNVVGAAVVLAFFCILALVFQEFRRMTHPDNAGDITTDFWNED